MSLLNSFRNHPQLSLCSLLLLLLGFMGAIFYLYNTDKNQQTSVEHYGQILAASSARQAVDATLNQDMVILQEVNQYPYVIGASLRNVDNKLLVQGGYRPNQPALGKRYNFTAPVALHNNVAGYLEVTLDVPRRTRQDEVFLACWGAAVAGALLVIWWSIYRQWWAGLRSKLPSADQLVTAVVDKIPTIPEEQPEVVPPTQVAVRLNLQIVNLNRLYQQLNSEGFNVLMKRFDKQLHSLLNLYNGQRQPLAGDLLLIDFTGEEFHECSFRALCCAQMLMNLTARSPSPRLQLAAAVAPINIQQQAGCALLKEFLSQQETTLSPAKNDILLSGNLLNSNLQQQAEFDMQTGKLLQIKAPYSDYLAKQEEQLLQRQ
jgi:uncharacterized membrane protein affecting hemolysin expression